MGLAIKLTSSGIDLLVEDGQLVVESSTPLTDSQRAFIRNHKDQLLAELTGKEAANDPILPLYCAADLDLALLRADQIFIDRLILYRSRSERCSLLNEYRLRWLAAAGAGNLLEHQRDNAGRFAANSWLRIQLH